MAGHGLLGQPCQLVRQLERARSDRSQSPQRLPRFGRAFGRILNHLARKIFSLETGSLVQSAWSCMVIPASPCSSGIVQLRAMRLLSANTRSNPCFSRRILMRYQSAMMPATSRASSGKSPALIEARLNRKAQRGVLFAPSSIGVAGHDTKPEIAGRQIGKERLASASRLGPALVIAVQQVAEGDFLGRDETQARIAHFQVAFQWAQTNSLVRFHAAASFRSRWK